MKLSAAMLERIKYDLMHIGGEGWLRWLLGSYYGRLHGDVPGELYTALVRLLNALDDVRNAVAKLDNKPGVQHRPPDGLAP